MTKDIKEFVKQCEVYQQSKHESVTLLGFLQPLPIPGSDNISMGFIERLSL